VQGSAVVAHPVSTATGWRALLHVLPEIGAETGAKTRPETGKHPLLIHDKAADGRIAPQTSRLGPILVITA
jgi:hypothetical protein